MEFTEHDKALLEKFLDKTQQAKLGGIASMDDLWSLADGDSRLLLERILALNPSDFGFLGKALPEEAIPNDIVLIDTSRYIHEGEYSVDPNSYVPNPVFAAFTRMNDAFSAAYPSRRLLVGSGYRSPAFQIATLLYILVKIYQFDVGKTLRHVAMPTYSQHCSVTNTAIDFVNVDGQPSDSQPELFKDSVEYVWLSQHANEFGFYESYPPGNSDGVIPEPWHWQYRPSLAYSPATLA